MSVRAWVVLLFGSSLLVASIFAPVLNHASAQGSAYQQATSYPVNTATFPFDNGYTDVTNTPGSSPSSPTSSTAATADSKTPTSQFSPTASLTPTVTFTAGPNAFKTEDSQLNNGQTGTGANQTFPATRTLTATLTSAAMQQGNKNALLSDTPTPGATGASSSLDWKSVALGFTLPFTVLAFFFLGIAFYREFRRNL